MTARHFDVRTAFRFVDGNIAGVEAFRAMLDESPMDAKDQAARILKVISEAVATVYDAKADTTRKSAAVKLLELVAKSLVLQARHSSYGAWLETKQGEAERCRKVLLRLESRRTARQAKEDARFQSFIAGVTAE